MKAVQINKYGGSEALEINENTPQPAPGKAQALIEVHAASINPFDVGLVSGYMQERIPLQFPYAVGGDFAGVVTEIGPPAGGVVSDYKIGDEVFGTAQVLGGGSGAFAEFAAANTANIAKKPTNATFIEAGALPLVGSSAVQALEETIKLGSGPTFAKASVGKQKILIHGAGGGIGHIAVQLAHAFGAYVAATAGTKDVEFVKSLGADQVINFQTQAFETMLKDFAAVFDNVGGETTNKSFLVLKKGGILVSMKGQPDQELAKKYKVIGLGLGTKINAAHLTRISELVDSGKVKVHIDRAFPMSEVKDAWTYQKEGHPQGKVVIKIKN